MIDYEAEFNHINEQNAEKIKVTSTIILKVVDKTKIKH